jgi:nucleoside-diphosphate-sugar epimerase
MHILITGANGFIGRYLVDRLLREHVQGGRQFEALTLIDIGFSYRPDQIARQFVGSIDDEEFLRRPFAKPVDLLFHLASVPGGAAEQQYRLSRNVNLNGTLALLEAAKAQAESHGRIARFVFASTVAVYGSPLPHQVNDATPLNPQMTYGSQKLIGELLVADFSRRGWIDGLSLRLPGVLARPPTRTGQASAFLSDIIRELKAGREFTCPMSSHAATWAMSIHSVIDNLLHSINADTDKLPARRSLLLPTLRFTMAELVDAIATLYGPQAHGSVRWVPDERIESWFGRFPPVATELADSLGFRRDADLATLVRRAIEPI